MNLTKQLALSLFQTGQKVLTWDPINGALQWEKDTPNLLVSDDMISGSAVGKGGVRRMYVVLWEECTIPSGTIQKPALGKPQLRLIRGGKV